MQIKCTNASTGQGVTVGSAEEFRGVVYGIALTRGESGDAADRMCDSILGAVRDSATVYNYQGWTFETR
ncbi:hypothetical protein [Streptomyces indicus]|uniref:Uncharacterized protein n=1 Tax=Streptomyces indicus TaxID=417292 RepID=A0A1G9A4J1_9ACTN|nr:hypothetical protein [Streptomyces indicus]SDK21370.1 hypothetical protein SAMN05421806_105323 [Streptomyces indicus]